MRNKTNEIFLVKDYDNGDITDYYLTNDARGCYSAMQDIDTIYEDDFEESCQDLIEELGKRKAKMLFNLKCDCWIDAFLRLCKYRGIVVKNVAGLECYEY